jgi:DNA-binding NtrC family response regulator
LKILLIDDEKELLSIINRRLSRKGFECLLANTLAQAQEHLQTHVADLGAIVSDLFLEHENGLNFLEVARQGGFQGPFVLTTGDEDGDVRVHTFKATQPNFFCLQKPYSFEELLKILTPDKES